MSRARIIIFAKAPVPGKAKTRLIAEIGEEGAARLARHMLLRTVSEAKAAGVGPVELCGTPDPAGPAWDGLLPAAKLHVTDQGDGDLGNRLARAARRALASGEPVLLIGTDCPDLTRARLIAAATALEDHDVVLLPASDGGYVLLGLRSFDSSLFRDIPWSTSAVTRETLDRITALGWTVDVGQILHDIDRPEDLVRLAQSSQQVIHSK